MNRMERLDRLVRAARRLPPPQVDVTASVIGRIRAPRPAGDASLAIFAGASAVAAAVVGVVAVQTWLNWQDPVVALLSAADVVLQ